MTPANRSRRSFATAKIKTILHIQKDLPVSLHPDPREAVPVPPEWLEAYSQAIVRQAMLVEGFDLAWYKDVLMRLSDPAMVLAPRARKTLMDLVMGHQRLPGGQP